MFPLRKELSCREISSMQFDKATELEKQQPSKPKTTPKQRRQSIFFMGRQASASSTAAAEKENAEPDANCPIYASKNKILRRKSIFEPSVSVEISDDNTSPAHQPLVVAEVEHNTCPAVPPTPPPMMPSTMPAAATASGSAFNYPPQATTSAPFSLSPTYLNTTTTTAGHWANERKNSLIHEIRVMSPRNSLSGIFYSSSIISVRNASLNDDSLQMKIDEDVEENSSGGGVDVDEDSNASTPPPLPPTTTEAAEATSLPTKLKNVTSDFVNKNRKFCIWFKWTAWMTERQEYSLFLFSKENRVRAYCLSLADHPYFDYVVLIFISFNCITLAMERPKIPPWSKERDFLSVANYLFTFVFAVEMLIKVIAKGLFYGREAYFHNGWNIMDGSLVGISLFDIFLSFFAQRSPRIFGILRVFRLLRSLRPLR